MENFLKKVAYLKGYADGLDINERTDEGKLFKKMIDVIDEMADAIADLGAQQDVLIDQVEAIDEDLSELEDDYYGEEDDDDEQDDLDYFEIECPNCKETVYIDDDFLDDDSPIVCPNCNQEIELDFSCDCGECGHDDDCDCGCESEGKDE